MVVIYIYRCVSQSYGTERAGRGVAVRAANSTAWECSVSEGRSKSLLGAPRSVLLGLSSSLPGYMWSRVREPSMENGNVLQHDFGRFSPEFFFFTIFSRISTAHLPPGHIAYCPFPNIVTGCFFFVFIFFCLGRLEINRERLLHHHHQQLCD